MKRLDKSFWAVSLTIAIIGTITWLVIFEHNFHPRVYRYDEDVTILQMGASELGFNHPEGAFSIWWQSGGRYERGDVPGVAKMPTYDRGRAQLRERPTTARVYRSDTDNVCHELHPDTLDKHMNGGGDGCQDWNP